MSDEKLTCDAFVHGANLQHRICGAPATGIHHGIGGDQPRCDEHAIPGMERIEPAGSGGTER